MPPGRGTTKRGGKTSLRCARGKGPTVFFLAEACHVRGGADLIS